MFVSVTIHLTNGKDTAKVWSYKVCHISETPDLLKDACLSANEMGFDIHKIEMNTVYN